MTLLDAITEAYLLATGKSTLPTDGSSKYNRLIGLAKKVYRDWQTESGTDWNSLYDLVSAGTVSATDEYQLDTDIVKLSQRDGDFVLITTTDDQVLTYDIINASKLYSNRYNKAVAKIADNKIKFARAFTTSDQAYGGTIQVPAYIKLDDLENLTDEVLIDNPAWLPVMIAAHYVLSDAQLQYKYPDLIAQANDLMAGMKLANNPQDETYNTGQFFFSVGGSDE